MPAYLLVAHGSRHPKAQIALSRLAQLVREQLETKYSKSLLNPPSLLIETACLEFATLPLHTKITQFARIAQETGFQSIQILPLFLLEGVHLREDIPAEIALAQQSLKNKVNMELKPYLGSYPGITKLLGKQFDLLNADGRILLAHGSGRPGANKIIEAIATQLEALPAYSFHSPSISAQVQALMAAGKEKIAILPYFLFPGTTVFTLTEQVELLQKKFSHLQLMLGQPLEPNLELADVIVEALEL